MNARTWLLHYRHIKKKEEENARRGLAIKGVNRGVVGPPHRRRGVVESPFVILLLLPYYHVCNDDIEPKLSGRKKAKGGSLSSIEEAKKYNFTVFKEMVTISCCAGVLRSFVFFLCFFFLFLTSLIFFTSRPHPAPTHLHTTRRQPYHHYHPHRPPSPPRPRAASGSPPSS